MQLIRKITPKTVLGQRPERPAKGTVDLFTVFGIASGFQDGQGEYGQWQKLKGTFEATNLESGEVFRSGACFLPEPINSMVVAELSATGDKKANSVQFSIKVSVKRTDTPIGYEYVATPIVDAGGADPLASLRDKTAKALPAPAKK